MGPIVEGAYYWLRLPQLPLFHSHPLSAPSAHLTCPIVLTSLCFNPFLQIKKNYSYPILPPLIIHPLSERWQCPTTWYRSCSYIYTRLICIIIHILTVVTSFKEMEWGKKACSTRTILERQKMGDVYMGSLVVKIFRASRFCTSSFIPQYNSTSSFW